MLGDKMSALTSRFGCHRLGSFLHVYRGDHLAANLTSDHIRLCLTSHGHGHDVRVGLGMCSHGSGSEGEEPDTSQKPIRNRGIWASLFTKASRSVLTDSFSADANVDAQCKLHDI